MQSKNRCLRVSDEIWGRWAEQAKAANMPIVQMLQTAMAALKHDPRPTNIYISDMPDIVVKKTAPGRAQRIVDAAREMRATCDHAGTEIGRLSGVGACPKCGKMVTK